jgi:hypothetical protein
MTPLLSSGMWSEVESIPTARYGHSCGLLTNWGTGELEVVAAGGNNYYFGGTLDSVEIFSINTRSWRKADRSLPEPRDFAASVAFR